MSFLLAFIILITSLPISLPAAAAQSSLRRAADDAEALLYISDAILTPEEDLDSAARPSKLFSESDLQNIQTDTGPLLSRIIHAKKMQRNDLDANCQLLIDQFLSQGKDCEAQRVREYCREKKGEINIQIGFYHKIRGDRRKLFTRMWHSLKRSGADFWHKIGPLGRNLLRNLGDESLQIVASGGTLSGATVKNLVRNQLKALGRKQIRQVVYQGIQNLLQGQIAIAKAAGQDLCAESADQDPSDSDSEQSGSSEQLILSISAPGLILSWSALYQPQDPDHSCGGTGAAADDQQLPDTFTLTIDPARQTLSGSYSGAQEIIWPASGPVESEISQSVRINVSGPYDYLNSEPDHHLDLVGSAEVELSSSGTVQCQYWTVPASGDPVLNTYTVQNSGNKNVTVPVEIGVQSDDGLTGSLRLDIVVPNWDTNSYFSLHSDRIPLTEEQMQIIWPDWPEE